MHSSVLILTSLIALGFLDYSLVLCRIHTLTLLKDERSSILLNSFGYLKGATLDVSVSLTVPTSIPSELIKKIGFTVDLTSSSNSTSYVEHNELTHSKKCALDPDLSQEVYENIQRALLVFEDIDKLKVYERDFKNVTFFENEEDKLHPKAPASKTTKKELGPVNQTVIHKRDVIERQPVSKSGFEEMKSLSAHVSTRDTHTIIRTSFYFSIDTVDQEGLYELYFRNCINQANLEHPLQINIRVNITARNKDTYLSAGEMALPTVYGVMASMFFFTSFIWMYLLCTTKNPVFKIHYLMAAVVFVKGLSITFHAVDYYFIGKNGKLEAWAIIFYVIHLLKGILLFMCLLLIATGWAFIKYILNDREKKIIMVVIPLQVITNVAYIIMDTEKGNTLYQSWGNIMVAVDLLCIALVFIPILWSIRHLQEASQTDGKAAINLAKLKLFQNFYVLIVFYLYFTRIMVYFLSSAVPFQYQWFSNLFQELGAFIFFVVTGYKFRPGCNNPYLLIPQDDDIESHAITKSGLIESVNKVNQYEKDAEETKEDDALLPKQRTSAL